MASVVAVGALGALGLAPAGNSAAPGSAAAIYVVQGLPDQQVTVSVDGDQVDTGLEGGKVGGPYELSAGEHTVEFTPSDGDAISRSIEVKGGSSADVVLHLPNQQDAAPLVTVFDNDVSPITAGQARLAVAHTAAVGPADIKVDGKVLFANVANGEGLTLDVPGGTYQVQIVPTGKNGPSVLGPAALSVKADELNRVYAIGNPEEKTMTVAAHVIPLQTTGSEMPGTVDTGTGGQAYRLGLTTR